MNTLLNEFSPKQTLDSLHIYAMSALEDSTKAGSEWTEVLQTVQQILYECAITDDIAFVSYVAKKLHHMLSRRKVTKADEAYYEISQLNSVYNVLLEKGRWFFKCTLSLKASEDCFVKTNFLSTCPVLFTI